MWKPILIRNTLRVSSTPKQYLPVSWEISSKYLNSIFYCTFISEKIQSPSNQFLLLDKLYVGKGLSCQLDGLKYLQSCELRWLTVETSKYVGRVFKPDWIRFRHHKRYLQVWWSWPGRGEVLIWTPQKSSSSETCNLLSNMSDWLSSVLKSADPARMSPEQLGLSFEMNNCTATSATWSWQVCYMVRGGVKVSWRLKSGDTVDHLDQLNNECCLTFLT